MSASPWELVEVNVRAPTAAEPQHTLMAECSLSTGTNSASSSPSATSSERCSTMWVCGVMGYAAITSTSACRTASAMAMETSTPFLFFFSMTHFSSLTMVMHFTGHSDAQIPQPLQ